MARSTSSRLTINTPWQSISQQVVNQKLFYFGFSQSEEKGSSGLFGAVKEAVSKCGVPWEVVFCKVTSIVAGGESANTGHRHSLWTHLSNERCSGDTPALLLMCR